jgi:hypothetical protein
MSVFYEIVQLEARMFHVEILDSSGRRIHEDLYSSEGEAIRQAEAYAQAYVMLRLNKRA